MNCLSVSTLKYLIILVLLGWSCRPQDNAGVKQDGQTVTITAAEEFLFQHIITASGRLSPSSELKLSFKTGGLIDNISIKEGQYVNRGELMASLNLSEVGPRFRQAELMYEKALRDYERTNNLYADTVATLEQLQNALTALEMAEYSRDIAGFNHDHSHIRAPVSGHVLKVLAEEKEFIPPGYPVLLFAASRDMWLLKVAVTDRDIIYINEGDRAEVRFDAHAGMVFEAAVAEIPGMADPNTGAFNISIALSSPEARLLTGFIGKATIMTSKAENYITIPPEALVEANRREGVIYRYKNGTAVKTDIKIEQITEDRLLVSGDIAKGDSIVVDGSRYIKNGQRLVLYEP
jgi:RND family efflux transporter MFP subunit